MDFSTTGGTHVGNSAGGCGGGSEKFNEANFDAAMSAAEDGGCECDGAEESEAAEESHGAECGGDMSVAERMEMLEKRIAELEESGNASPEELAELREELMSLRSMEGLDDKTIETLDGLSERLDALSNQPVQ